MTGYRSSTPIRIRAKSQKDGNFNHYEQRAAEEQRAAGLNKARAAKAAANYGRQLEAACRKWVQDVTGASFADGSSLQEELQSGVVLCQLCNTIRPGVCKKPSAVSAPLKQMETIASYLTACDVIGVPKHRQFQTVTLYENKDFTAIDNIASYLAACDVLGVPKHRQFQTVALYENRDIMQVLINLQALARAAQRELTYKGPSFGGACQLNWKNVYKAYTT